VDSVATDSTLSERPNAGGLTSTEVAGRLRQFGYNESLPDRAHPLLALLARFWGPVPWMLELTVALELALGRAGEATIMGGLLVFNAAVGALQEGRARGALRLLRQRLRVRARVLRDGTWLTLDARELVPGDLIHVRVGDVVPADLRLISGQVLLDQSAVTGESLPVDAVAGAAAYAGTIVRRGEASAQVTATGVQTAFGKTAKLVGQAESPGHLQSFIFSIVKYLIAMDIALVVVVMAYALVARMPMREALPFALMLLIASVPVALPATFTLATALGAIELARQGVLVTRLAAIEEAAAMDVLCSDKTGTITENRLTVAALHPGAGRAEDELLRDAALASDASTQDPIDLAILEAVKSRGLRIDTTAREFIPFDPATKRSEARISTDSRTIRRFVKGAPSVVLGLCSSGGEWAQLQTQIANLSADGARVLAVAEGTEGALKFVGLVALSDPPREDSVRLVRDLRELGVRVVMVTGDGQATASAVAARVGIGSRVCPAGPIKQLGTEAEKYDVFAGVLPEDKYDLVRSFQTQGHTTGMTGDGVNDAPALKQAEVGIAVSNATDVAKSAASVVLTNAGLQDVVAAVQTSRRIYQRMLTYTLNKIIKTCEISLFLSLGLVLTGTFVTTPTLIVLLLFTNDFVTMSIATDRVTFSARPSRWHVRGLVLAAVAMAAMLLLLSFAILFAARLWLHLSTSQLQTLVFVMLVFSGQGTVYLVRERRHFWRSRPSAWMVAGTAFDLVLVWTLATNGILMAPISGEVISVVFCLVVVYLALLDPVKVALLRST